jgi:hypothetical protein
VSSAALLLHPVRLRVVQTFLGRESLTTSELHALLPDVPTASLYRHVSLLLDGGVLEVTEEHRVRGAVERTLRLRVEAASVSLEDVRAMSADEHRQAFTTFVAGLLADFDRYLGDGDAIDVERDLVGYRQAALHLTDAETVELLTELSAVLLPRLQNQPGPGRRRRVLSTVLMPTTDPVESGHA